MASPANIASQTRLPPSPELQGVTHLGTSSTFNDGGWTLDKDQLHNYHHYNTKLLSSPARRLCSVACYASFHPEALACSPPLKNQPTSTTAAGRNAGAGASSTTGAKDPGLFSSLGAVAGTDGVAIFRVEQPHVPLLLLSHDAGAAAAATTITTSLRFSNSLQLASARGSGVLVWDVSGHSLSPLQGRLQGLDPAGDSSNLITSMTWKPTDSDESWLAATTATSAGVWDLRSSSAAVRPSLCFGVINPSTVRNNRSIRYLQIACNRQHACAILDSAGIVRVFDTRKTSGTRSSNNNALCQFQAYPFAGVGLSFLPLVDAKHENNNTCNNYAWVTWGLDAPRADAVVKVWKSGEPAATTTDAAGMYQDLPEDYWYLDDSPSNKQSSRKSTSKSTVNSNSSSNMGYHLVGQCTQPSLACARVCPSPVENSLVTVGLDTVDGWRAELWQLQSLSQSLEKVATFCGSIESTEQQNLQTVLGPSQARMLRSIRASELAVGMYSVSIPMVASSKETSSSSSPVEYGLLLCCLTENGYVTTHAIPEALPEKPVATTITTTLPSLSSSTAAAAGQDTKKQQRLGGNSTIAAVAPPRQRFPAEWEGAIHDAANAWFKPGVVNDTFLSDNATTTELLSTNGEWRETPNGSRGGSLHGIATNSVAATTELSSVVDGGMMPFDMDVPVAYSMTNAGITGGIPNAVAARNELVSPGVVPTGGSGEDKDQMDRRAIEAAAIMKNIDTDRIPCPRLCGATFSFGVGGLAAFHNGNVQKMWHWWERSEPTRLAAIPGLIGEPSFNDPKKPRSLSTTGSGDVPGSVPTLITTSCPRTLKDLMSMTKAAKEAQWGEHDESDGSSTGFPALGGNFFEDDSDASSDSGDDPLEEGAEVSESKRQPKDLFGSYFDTRQRPVPLSSDISQGTSEQTSKGDDAPAGVFSPSVGPASDMLTPLVKVSHEYDRIALNGQTPDLALGFQLGDLRAGSHYGLHPLLDETHSPLESKIKQPLPSYRSLREPKNMTREEERGVHGGVHATRPNMQESMVFLRKLFTHQMQEGTNASYSNLISPPDSPLLPNSLNNGHRKSSPEFDLSVRSPRAGRHSDASQHLQQQSGVFTLPLRYEVSEDEALVNVERRCLHNANVCERLGEHQKKETWIVVSKIVRSRIQRLGQGFDGWGGLGGGSLGVGLVANILRYYEALGDVQMLSTLVCVLRDRRSTLQCGGQRGWLLLPSDQDMRYDAYIRLYANILYGWSLLTIRAELNKHLIRSAPMVVCGGLDSTDAVNETHSSPGIAFVVKCPRCSNDSEFDTNYCRSCRDYAFRCALCDQAVRGLFTVCDVCGHGGHVNHMAEWFASHDPCPSGCGCNCRLASSSILQRETGFLPNILQPSMQLTQ